MKKLLLPIGAALAVAVGILGLEIADGYKISVFAIICIFFLLSGYIIGVGYGRKEEA